MQFEQVHIKFWKAKTKIWYYVNYEQIMILLLIELSYFHSVSPGLLKAIVIVQMIL